MMRQWRHPMACYTPVLCCYQDVGDTRDWRTQENCTRISYTEERSAKMTGSGCLLCEGSRGFVIHPHFPYRVCHPWHSLGMEHSHWRSVTAHSLAIFWFLTYCQNWTTVEGFQSHLNHSQTSPKMASACPLAQ